MFYPDGAGGGIRTHEDLSQRILSPPPCPRGRFGRLFRPGSGTPAPAPHTSLQGTV